MWVLKNPQGGIRYLRPNKTLTFGRKQTDLILDNDSSISRVHASITVTLKDHMTTSEVSSVCIVKDANSKYGTFVIRNGISMRASSAEGLEVQHLDTLKFGLQQHTFTVEHLPFVTCVSRLSNEHKQKLKDIMDDIGGVITDTFDDNCTHLTVSTATTTTKTISALTAGLPIIDVNYWAACLRAIQRDGKLPDANGYVLTLEERGLNTQKVSLKPNPARKTLFQGKTFVFFSEKGYKEYKRMIKEAGGKAELHTLSREDVPDSLLDEGNVIMQVTQDGLTDELSRVNSGKLLEKMKNRRMRMVMESELPLAIMYASSSQYCNPNYHFKELMRRKGHKDTSEVVAVDTQDFLAPDSNADGKAKSGGLECIPETADFMQESVSQDEDCSSVKVCESEDVQDQSLRFEESLSQKENDEQLLVKKTLKQKSKDLLKTVPPKRQKTDDVLESVKVENKNIDSEVVPKEKSKLKVLNRSPEPVTKKKEKKEREEASGWQNTELQNPGKTSEKKKKQAPPFDISRDFDEFERQKSEVKERKPDKLKQWGFKKSERKASDFDLDDMDLDDADSKQNQAVVHVKDKKENKKRVIEDDDEKPFKSVKKDDKEKDIRVKVLDVDMGKPTKSWTHAKPSRSKDGLENESPVKAEIGGSILLKSSIKIEPGMTNHKVFKKAYNQVPTRRILLSSMTAWSSSNK